MLPVLVLLCALAVLAWSARDALWPAVEVRVVPVVAKPRAADANGSEESEAGSATIAAREQTIVQAPGWIEPDPFAVTVPALTDGVVKEVLVLEGQRVEAGEVLARLIDDDANLTLRRARAELAERAAAVKQLSAALAAAVARAAVAQDEVDRKRSLAGDGSVSAAQLARLELQLVAVQAEVASAEASVASAEAAHGTQQVAVDQALLALARTEIRTPVAGIVLSRSVEPGTRLTMTSPGPGEAHEAGVARLYDPSRLQVRVDVPLADAAKVGVGTRARIVTEALPDIAFAGVVTRIVHEANIQRNTVQFKVSIENPVPTLKPEMLARVRLLGTDDAADGRAGGESGSESLALLLPESVLIETTEASAAAWMIGHDARGGTIAVKRRLTIGARHGDGFVEITAGAAATDRAIASPSSAIAEGVRVRVIGELAGTDGDAQ